MNQNKHEEANTDLRVPSELLQLSVEGVCRIDFWELNEVQSPYVVGLNKRNDFCEN